MNSELVIDFKNDGSVASLHTDAFDLGFLGDKKVYRQTDIVFNSDTQLWDMDYLINGNPQYRFIGQELSGFESYETARAYEVRWLNACRLAGMNPASNMALCLMKQIRES